MMFGAVHLLALVSLLQSGSPLPTSSSLDSSNTDLTAPSALAEPHREQQYPDDAVILLHQATDVEDLKTLEITVEQAGEFDLVCVPASQLTEAAKIIRAHSQKTVLLDRQTQGSASAAASVSSGTSSSFFGWSVEHGSASSSHEHSSTSTSKHSSSSTSTSKHASSSSSSNKHSSSAAQNQDSSSSSSTSEGNSRLTAGKQGTASGDRNQGVSSLHSLSEDESGLTTGSQGSSSSSSTNEDSSRITGGDESSSSSSSASNEYSSGALNQGVSSSNSIREDESGLTTGSQESSFSSSVSKQDSLSAAASQGAASSLDAASVGASSSVDISQGASSSSSTSEGASSSAAASQGVSSSSSASEGASSSAAASQGASSSSSASEGASSSAAASQGASSSAAASEGASSSAAASEGASSSSSASEGASSSAAASQGASSSSSASEGASSSAAASQGVSSSSSASENTSSSGAASGGTSSSAAVNQGISSSASASDGASDSTKESQRTSSSSGSGSQVSSSSTSIGAAEDSSSAAGITNSGSFSSERLQNSDSSSSSSYESGHLAEVQGELSSSSDQHSSHVDHHVEVLRQPSSSSDSCVCVAYYLCHEDQIISDGAGLIDIRFNNNQQQEDVSLTNSQCPNFLDVCCSVPLDRPHPDMVGELLDDEEYTPSCGRRRKGGLSVFIEGFKDGESQFAEIPWMAIITEQLMFDGHPNQKFVCGGSLIHEQVVLTAAHCVSGKSAGALTVRLGDWDTKHEKELYPHVEVDVARIRVHPRFNPRSLFNNVALLVLSRPVERQRHIDTVCLPAEGEVNLPSSCVATGFGKDRFDGGQYQNVMKQVELNLVDSGQCQDRLRTTKLGRHFRLHPSFTCAGGLEGVDTCQGDGGSPLACPSLQDSGRYVQVGIVSWGIGCGEQGIPGVYADVPKMMPWIRRQMAEERFQINDEETSHEPLTQLYTQPNY